MSKEQVLEILEKRTEWTTAEQIQEKLQQKKINISLSTINTNLRKLTRQKEIKTIISCTPKGKPKLKYKTKWDSTSK